MKKKNKLSIRNKMSSAYPEECTGKWNACRLYISNASKNDSLFKKKKKKKKGDIKMEQNYEDSTNDKATMNADKFYDTLRDNYQNLNKDEKSDSNILYKGEWARINPIVSALEGDSLVKKKKKKKKGDKKMEQNYEDLTIDKATIYGLHSHENVITGQTPLQCDVCFKTFTYLSILVVHKRTHTGEKPYECGQCEKKFSSSNHCKRHTLGVHTKCL